MPLNKDRTETEQTSFSRRRFRAAVELRGLSIEGMARSCEVSARHLWYIVTGQRRPSAQLLDKVHALLGESGWLFATGQADSLREQGGQHAEP